jgi:hyperosmotically inducible protein
MTKIALLLSLVLLVLVGYAGIAHLAERIPLPPARTASDNTGGTVQYRSGATRTPDDPSESTADRSLSQWLRQAVVTDMALSPTARRITISTSERIVTLRGLVNSPQERERIEAKVQYIAGQNKVDNQLEIKPLTPQ